MKTIYKILLSFVFLIATISCDDYLDVNENKNQLVEVPTGTLLLKGTLLANAQVQQGHLSRTSMYYTGGLIGLQLVQQTLYNYDYTPGDSNGTWSQVYNGILVQNKEIRRLSPNLDLLNGIIDVNEALAVGTATSLFGDIPYSAAVPDGASLNSPDPTFDAQADVYASLQTLLDGAINKITNATTSVGSEDIYNNGSKTKWVQAANTLKARYYLQTKQYAQALNYVGSGISSAANTLAYHPIGEVDGNSNILSNFVTSSRAGDMTGNGAFYRDLIDPANGNSRNNAKTDEMARRKYSYIKGNGEQADGIDDPATAMKLVSYEENLLIWAECLLRGGNTQDAIDKLNQLRAFLNSGSAFNLISGTDTFMYAAYDLTDFQTGGMENMDNIATDRAVLREIIEERYVTGFTTFMPFNDARRLKKSDSDVIVPFPFQDRGQPVPSVNPQRLLYPQDEINANSNIPSPIPDIFTPTPINQ
ncbi:MAG: SusD/RagB family nutrient-binding outer membrane lipoprotein [Flavobacteriales bacterium]|jgi:starch-binding outer membrane protein, SusD/RagB family|nr:SusD/RagB family nutrient-binding outer membrane lipoprotein [Flavobacteriales bacterium]